MTRQKPAPLQSDQNIQSTIETICEQGCTIVRQTMESIESNQTSGSAHISDLLEDTTEAQQQKILEELKTIMAVYDDKDCSDT